MPSAFPEIDFSAIAARGGAQDAAFEDLCSQLAAKTLEAGLKFERFWGAGGDGGVECLATLDDLSQIGWQAKYVFDVEGLIKQAAESLATALSVHKQLTKYVVCFPFDLTGPTNRKTKTGKQTKSGSEKFREWTEKAITAAKVQGRELEIEAWPANVIQSKLVEKDLSGGIRFYFFSSVPLSVEWFGRHLAAAAKTAGPRYTPELNVQTDLSTWFSTLEGGAAWQDRLASLLTGYHGAIDELRQRLDKPADDDSAPTWPRAELQVGRDALAAAENLLAKAQTLRGKLTDGGVREVSSALAVTQALRSALGRAANDQLILPPEAKGSFSNNVLVRMLIRQEEEFDEWFHSPGGFLAWTKTFVLSGAGGSGKTHGICDTAFERLKKGAYTGIVFGHQFNGEPDVWSRMLESLGLPAVLGKDGLLDALDAAGRSSGKPLLICIDAINETRPRDYWRNRLASIAFEIEQRPYLKLCLSCRSSFLPICLPHDVSYPVVEHLGFSGFERKACNAFFQFYELEPPLSPILQPELSNPLYLKLVCQTLKLRGLRQLPVGWTGLAPVIRGFLSEKEKQFAAEHGISTGSAIVGGSLSAIADAITTSGNSALLWSTAYSVVNAKVPQATNHSVLEWLVQADLLIEDGPPAESVLAGESTLRPAFERLGDFLVAAEMLSKLATDTPETHFTGSGRMAHLCTDAQAVAGNAGILSALSILIPEKWADTELPDLAPAAPIRPLLSEIAIEALGWRTPETFGPATRAMLQEGIATAEAWNAVDSLISVASQSSAIDAFWIDSLLQKMSLAKRDAICASYLHDRFDQSGPVKRLIDATTDVLLDRLEDATAERWALLLIWFTAAPDRRVKDRATRSAVALLRAKPVIIPGLLVHFLAVDDDEVRERILLCAYGALLLSPDLPVLKRVAEMCLAAYAKSPLDFQNALIRDHMRCLAEFARFHDVLGPDFDPLITSNKDVSEWPLVLASEEQIETWRKKDDGMELLVESCLDDDFFNYTIMCLHEWFGGMDKASSAGWIIKHVVENLGYDGSGCDRYDTYMTREHGGGRSKPVWAERIGKKYQWLALFRLASRMHDNLAREVGSWDPEPSRQPLILQDERKLDPTLTTMEPGQRSPSACWWLKSTVDLAATKALDFPTWQKLRDDLPDLGTLLNPIAYGEQQWRLLTANATFSDQTAHDTRSRYTWFHLRSFLIPDAMFVEACAALVGRNLFGDWMPNGASWLHSFAGEYPWATVYDPALDHWHGWDGKVDGSSITFLPTSNQVTAEWQYDGGLAQSIYMYVPAREFFLGGQLRWDGKDGFRTKEGKTVFRDPHATEGGNESLIADNEDLTPRLAKLGYRLLWTLLGEKTILNNKSPGIVYSQLAELNTDGTITIGERFFFDDLDQDQGLRRGGDPT